MENKLANNSKYFYSVRDRLAIFIASLFYFCSLTYVLKECASKVWYMYGFSFGSISYLDILLIIINISITSFFVPIKIDKPSSLFLIINYLFVIIPSFSCMFGFEREFEGLYYLLSVIISMSFSLSCYLVNIFNFKNSDRIERNSVRNLLFLSWLLLALFLYYRFGSIMKISHLDDIYKQRVQGSAKDLYEGYAQVYFQYVFSPALIVLGLNRKKILLIFLGMLGALISYMITAEKAGIMFPLFIIAMYFSSIYKSKIFSSTIFIAIIFAIVNYCSIYARTFSGSADFISWYFAMRSLIIPGGMIVYYYDYFGEHGFTYLSNIRGLDSLISVPLYYYNDPRWPSLGLIIGEEYLNYPTLNSNANFVASDAIAGFGLLGIPIMMSTFTAFLLVLDWVTRGIRNQLRLPILVPLALTLTNGSLFTVITSFGGAFWVFYFSFFRKKGDLTNYF